MHSILHATLILSFIAVPESQHVDHIYKTNWQGLEFTDKEHVLPNGSRVDLLTETHAIEVDFARKWEEAVGQSLYYGISTNRRPGIILLKAGQEDDEDYLMCLMVCRKVGIDLFVYKITPE